MAYHPLANDTGGTADDRRAEATRIINMLDIEHVTGILTDKELDFTLQVRHPLTPITPKQLFWLRDIKDKYL